MAIKRMPIKQFVEQLAAALKRGDGYIMGATGQNPRSWTTTSWWFTQYSGTQRAKALYWRENAARVWDCNGLAEGIYQEFAGISINTYARLNYANWCGKRGTGLIPESYRVPGAAVFWGDSASEIHHVGYLYKPVNTSNPGGDWYIIEARGVMYGVVQTRLFSRLPRYWGIMDKYFDYSAVMGGAAAADPVTMHLGDRMLRNGCEGEDVMELQRILVELGYDCGRWGIDGEFGDATELAVKAYQRTKGLAVDGIAGPKTIAAMEADIAAHKGAGRPQEVEIVGGSCYVREAPNVNGRVIDAISAGTVLPYDGEIADNGWLKVIHKGRSGWVSGKYGRLVV